MMISKEDLVWAASKGLILQEQIEPLWKAVSEKKGKISPTFNFSNVLYYLGTLIVILALGWFMTLGWERLGGKGIFIISCLYIVSFVFLGTSLWHRSNYRIVGGLLITVAVCTVPLMIYGLEKWIGIWPSADPDAYQQYFTQVKGHWLFMDLGLFLSSLIAIYFFRFSFLVLPLVFSFWSLSLDSLSLLGRQELTLTAQLWASLCVGIWLIGTSYFIDRFSSQDFAFWGYVFGGIVFWTSLTFLIGDTETYKFLYFLINIGLVGLSILIDRRIFVILGGLGIFGYFGYLAYEVFAHSIFFPFVLSLVGLGTIYLGIFVQRYSKTVNH